MKITINNKTYELPDALTITEVLKAVDRPTDGIAVARNGKVIPAKELAATKVIDGDNLMVIKAFYGG